MPLLTSSSRWSQCTRRSRLLLLLRSSLQTNTTISRTSTTTVQQTVQPAKDNTTSAREATVDCRSIHRRSRSSLKLSLELVTKASLIIKPLTLRSTLTKDLDSTLLLTKAKTAITTTITTISTKLLEP